MSPINNEMWYRLTSSGSGFSNFRYYAEIYYSPLPTIVLQNIGRYKIPVRPTGDGLFTPHTQLKPYLEWSFNPLTTAVQGNGDMALLYTIAPGIGYNPNWRYTSSFRGAVISPADYPNVKTPPGWVWGPGTYYYLGLTGPAVHNMTVGDEITISKDRKNINFFYDGETEIVQINSITSLTVKTLYFADTFTTDTSTDPPDYTEQGYFTDLIRIQTQDTLGRYAYHGSRQWDQKGLDFSSFTIRSVPGGGFPMAELLPLPLRGGITPVYYKQSYLSQFDFTKGWKKIYSNQPETINFLYNFAGGTTDRIVIKYYDKSFTLLTSTNISMTSLAGTTFWYYGMQVGLSNLIGTEWTNSVAPGAKYYTVGITRSSGSPADHISGEARYEIAERDCRFENYRLCWLNKMGGYDYFNFSKEHENSMDVQRKEWNQQLAWNYTWQSGARETSIYNVDASETVTINTDWLTDVEYAMLQDLFTSPDVYLLEETPWIGSTPAVINKQPIVIVDTAFRQKTQRREMVFNLTVKFKYSHKLSIQTN
jgi:hypothetical protein